MPHGPRAAHCDDLQEARGSEHCGALDGAAGSERTRRERGACDRGRPVVRWEAFVVVVAVVDLRWICDVL